MKKTSTISAMQVAGLMLISSLATTPSSVAQSATRTFTFDSDFDQGLLVNVNHSTISDQLQLNNQTGTFPFIWVACSARGTVARIDVATGQILGEYLSSPNGFSRNPSRTTVDANGNVWVGSRDEAGSIDGAFAYGSVVKIGLVVGGTRGSKNPDGSFTPDPNGQYLQPPFLYSTAVDRDGDGLIRTSRGLGSILDWNSVTDGSGGGAAMGSALVEDAQDECILVYQRLQDAPNARHVSIDRDNNVWAGGYPFEQRRFYKLDGTTGAKLATFDARTYGAGGYGGLLDANGILWSSSISQNTLLRYDPSTGTGIAIPATQSYGIGIDQTGHIWVSGYNGQLFKFTPAGVLVTGFPKSTGGGETRGLAVTADGDVWVANSANGHVVRFDNAGNIRKVIGTGAYPTGVAVDRVGKVWVTNRDSNNTVRIDPAAGGDGLGAADLTVDLGPGSGPYNYSDMTGNVLLGTIQQGFWSVVHDGLTDGLKWSSINWHSHEPAGTNLTVAVRAADSQTALAGLPFIAVTNASQLSGVEGRYMEVKTTLSRDSGVVDSPLLFELTVNAPRDREFVAVTGQAVPNEPHNVQWKSFGAPSINSDGGAAFTAALRSGVATVNPTENTGIFAETESGLQLIAQKGDRPPGVPESNVVFVKFGDVLYGNETVAFLADLKSTLLATPVPKDSDSGLWQTINGQLTLIAREGGSVPGVLDARFAKFLSVGLPGDAGVVFYGSMLTGVGGVSKENDTGLWALNETGTLELLLREGQSFEVGPGQNLTIQKIDVLRSVTGSFGQGHSLNEQGDIVVRLTFLTKEQAIVRCGAESSPEVIALSGTEVASMPGAKWKSFGIPSINGDGAVAFSAKLTSGFGGVTPADDSAIFVDWFGNLQLIVREGVTTAGAAGTISKFADPVMNNWGQIAFSGEAIIGGVKRKAVWSSWGPHLFELAAIGGPAPGIPGATIKKINSLAINHLGALFTAQLNPGGNVTKNNDLVLFGPETPQSLSPLVREGDTLHVDGTPKTIGTFNALKSIGRSPGQRRSFNAAGEVIVQANFTDKTQGVFVIRGGHESMPD